ncbi:MAG: hypothetical protein IPM64_10540 [Phycisphaerales bacterium]|nr:hypothetical protein [Phycisphaerales bacterium]
MDAVEKLAASLSELSENSRRLIRAMQHANFGRITISVRDGGPDAAATWHIQRTVKLVGGENGPRPETSCADFPLRNEHKALFGELKQLPDGVRVTIEIKHGLPVFIEVNQACDA